MKEMFRVLSLSMLVFVMSLSTVYAKDGYWTAELGAFSSDESAFDMGYSLEGGYGVPLTSVLTNLDANKPFFSKVWLEAETGYMHADFEEKTVIPGIPGLIPDQVLKVEGDVDVIPVTVSALIRHPLNQHFEVYGGAGLGLYLVMLDAGATDDDSIELGALIRGGAAFSFNDKIAATGELKFSQVGEDAAGGFNINLGVRYSF